jgi:hypothetical protein
MDIAMMYYCQVIAEISFYIGDSKSLHVTSHLHSGRRSFFANSSFLIFRTANRNGKALSDLKGAAYEA